MPVQAAEYVDYHQVPEHQREMDARLRRWARWVQPRLSPWKMHPMWHYFRSGYRQWHVPEIFDQISPLEALETEKAISFLPGKERDAVRWCYFFRCDPTRAARSLGLSKQGLSDAVTRGRQMLVNRLR